jgi:phage major head subunit gpT-like protein
MQINTPALQSCFVAFNTAFQKGFNSAQPRLSQFATFIPSTGKSNVYAFMLKLLKMRQWIGEREIQNISSASYQLDNLLYELSVAVDANDIKDDSLGVYGPLMEAMGEQVALWSEDLLLAALLAGESATTFDKVAFFSKSHPVDLAGRVSGTQSNLFDSSDGATGVDEATYSAALVKMSTLLGSDGRPLGCQATDVLVHPSQEFAMKKLVAAAYGANGSTNVYQGTTKVTVLPQLTNAKEFYLVDNSRPIKPLIMQVRESPDFVSYTDPKDERVFKNNEFVYGSKARGAAGYGLWFTALKVKLP